MMSMNIPPAEWFSAANESRVMWMALIIALGGSCAPSKLSTRITAPTPAMSFSCRAISSGSSESASICSRVSADPNVVLRSDALVCGSRPTVTSSDSLASRSTTPCRLSPAFSCTSRTTPISNPGNSALIE